MHLSGLAFSVDVWRRTWFQYCIWPVFFCMLLQYNVCCSHHVGHRSDVFIL